MNDQSQFDGAGLGLGVRHSGRRGRKWAIKANLANGAGWQVWARPAKMDDRSQFDALNSGLGVRGLKSTPAR
jgi:hypothetical protein